MTSLQTGRIDGKEHQRAERRAVRARALEISLSEERSHLEILSYQMRSRISCSIP